jgi:uncharacterized phage protein (TIGR02220 family)
MPNRIIKESIKRSEQINKLSYFEEVVYYRLMVTADDYGYCDGRIVLLKNELFPLKESITKKAMEEAITNLVKVGLLCSYKVNDIPYLFFPTWEKHQRIRNKHHKFPMPSESDTNIVCQTNDGQTSASCMSESESESNPNLNPKNNVELNLGSETDLEAADNEKMAKQIIDHLNERTGSHYKYSSSSMKVIFARLHDNFTVEDCITVIDKKSDEWLDNPEMAQYLRPETLFRPSKFEGYLNQPVSKKKSSRVKIDIPEYMQKPIKQSDPASKEQIEEALKMQQEMKERHNQK